MYARRPSGVIAMSRGSSGRAIVVNPEPGRVPAAAPGRVASWMVTPISAATSSAPTVASATTSGGRA